MTRISDSPEPEGGGGAQGVQIPSGKSQVGICFFRNTGTDPPHEEIGPLGSRNNWTPL